MELKKIANPLIVEYLRGMTEEWMPHPFLTNWTSHVLIKNMPKLLRDVNHVHESG